MPNKTLHRTAYPLRSKATGELEKSMGAARIILLTMAFEHDTFIIVMEMTDNHRIVLPLMATALIAHGISRIVCQEPLYKALAERFLRRMAG